MASLKETTELLGKLISFPSVSSDSNLDLINFLAEYLERAGARVITQPSVDGIKANLWATLGPEGPGGIVLSGHSDVVPVTDQDWTSDPFEMVERDGKLLGRGTCDMKGLSQQLRSKRQITPPNPLKGRYIFRLHMTRKPPVWAFKILPNG